MPRAFPACERQPFLIIIDIWILLVDDLSNRLAHRLRLERDSRGWSLADLAERSGVSKATISKIERAEVSPTAVVLVRLASAFDLTLAGLMLRAEGQGERLSRPANSRSGAIPKPAICARRCSTAPIIRSRSSGRVAGTAARDAAGFVLRAYPSGGLGAGRRPRDHRGRRRGMCSAPATASGSVRRRKRPLPTRAAHPAPMSWRWPGASRDVGDRARKHPSIEQADSGKTVRGRPQWRPTARG